MAEAHPGLPKLVIIPGGRPHGATREPPGDRFAPILGFLEESLVIPRVRRPARIPLQRRGPLGAIILASMRADGSP